MVGGGGVRLIGMERILTSTWHLPDSHRLAVYQKHGGYSSLRKALRMSSDDIMKKGTADDTAKANTVVKAVAAAMAMLESKLLGEQ